MAIHAARFDQCDVLHLLARHSPSVLMSMDPNDYGSLLRRAIWSGAHSVIDYLLANQPSLVSHPDQMRRLPLHVACQVGDAVTAAKLISLNPDSICALDDVGRTPLIAAIHSSLTSTVRSILVHAPHLAEQKDTLGETPLSQAQLSGNYEIAEIILNTLTRFTERLNGPSLRQHTR